MEALHVETHKTHQKPLSRLEIIKEDLIKLALTPSNIYKNPVKFSK